MYEIIKLGLMPEGSSINWYIVDQNNEEMLLLAQNGLDVAAFINPDSKIKPDKLKGFYYENSDLKQWLNEYFLKHYFSEKEQKQICSITIPSANDIETWFSTEIERICFPTQQALDHGASVFQHSSSNTKPCTYWLSDIGRKAGYSTTIVMANGKIYKSAYMSATNVCVRPLITVKRKEFSL